MRRIIISISEKDLNNLDIVSSELKDLGLNISDVHDFGVISGTIDEDKIFDEIKNHPSVEEVNDDNEARAIA